MKRSICNWRDRLLPLPFLFLIESMLYVFSFRMVLFYLVTTGRIFYISLCENTIDQLKKKKNSTRQQAAYVQQFFRRVLLLIAQTSTYML